MSQNPAFARLFQSQTFGSGGGGSGGGTQTVTQVQQIPDWQQQAIPNNEATARSLASNPYPTYNAPIVADLNQNEQTGLQNAFNYAYSSYAPGMTEAQTTLTNAGAMNPTANTGSAVNALNASTAAMNPFPAVSQGVYGLNAATAAMNPVPGVSNAVNALDSQAAGMNPVGQATQGVNSLALANLAKDPANAGVIQSYMNPYVQAALQPQLQAAQLQLANQQAQINSAATGANAFGDARQGMQNAYANFLGNQTMSGIEAQGYNTAYNSALQAAQNEQTNLLNLGNQQLNLGTLGVNEQNALSNLAGNQLGLGTLGVNEQGVNNQMASNLLNVGSLGVNEQGVNNAMAQNQLQLGQLGINAQQALGQIGMDQGQLATQNQTDALTAANAQYNAGNIQQQNLQNQLTAAYQQYENQVNWPYQMLNVEESAVNSNPYLLSNSTTIPNNPLSGLGSFASLAGALGSLTGSGGKAL